MKPSGIEVVGGRPIRRAFLLQNGLRSGSSHYLDETRGWYRLLPGVGFTPHVLAHNNCDANILEELSARPTFRARPDSDINSPDVYRKLRTFIEISAMFARDLRILDTDAPCSSDLIVVPYAAEAEIFGLARWVEGHAARGGDVPRAVVVVHRPDFEWQWNAEGTRPTSDISHMAYACHRFAQALGADRNLILTTTARLAELFATFAEGPILAGCAPLDYDDATTPSPGAASREFDFAFLGQMRPEKGSRILAAIVSGYLARRPQARVALQLDPAEQPERYLDGFETIRDDPRIHWMPGSLDRATFGSMLHRTRCVLLPFEEERYRMRISGVFSDAVAAGCPVVVPAGTWMADMLSAGHGAGLTALRSHPAVYIRAVERLVDDGGTLLAQARERAEAWRHAQSLERLIAIIAEQFPAS